VTLVLTAQMRLDAAQTKGELEATKRGIQGVTAATAEQATKSRAAAGAADAEAAAKRRNAQASRELTTANRGAAGATGNLVAQFNDIGMMLAAGQNPLQLAIRQGTQITQVIGPMGAAGAARALGSAFLGMLNPLSLITLGVIAASASMIQWLTSADDDAAAVTAELERQKSALEGIVGETEKLRLARGMLLSGAKSEDEQVALEQINALLEERRKVSEQLEQQESTMRRAAGAGAQIVAQAKQQELQAEIALIDAKIAALIKQREQTAATELTLAAAQRVQSVMAAVGDANLTAPWNNVIPSIDAAIGKALEYAGAMQSAQSAANLETLLYNTGQDSGPDAVRTKINGGGRFTPVVRGAGLPAIRAPKVSGGGGASAAEKEAEALQDLITSLEDEIATLRESDPVQKELLQHRKAMEGATEAERLKVEELIATREREKAAMEAIQELQQFKEDLVEGALDSLIAKGQSLKEVLDQVIIALMKAIIQAAIFGSGPLGSMFGGGGIGALIFGGGKAEGGMVHGPGTGTSDSVLTPLSNGEYVVNARATAQNRHLLEAINSGGRIPGFAQGGYVGTDNRRMAARGEGGGDTHIHMHLAGAKGDREIEMLARKGTEAALKDYDRNAAPATVRRVSSDPRRTG
jgi:hypothetical protein